MCFSLFENIFASRRWRYCLPNIFFRCYYESILDTKYTKWLPHGYLCKILVDLERSFEFSVHSNSSFAPTLNLLKLTEYSWIEENYVRFLWNVLHEITVSSKWIGFSFAIKAFRILRGNVSRNETEALNKLHFHIFHIIMPWIQLPWVVQRVMINELLPVWLSVSRVFNLLNWAEKWYCRHFDKSNFDLPNTTDEDGEFSLFRDTVIMQQMVRIDIFHKTHVHQMWEACTSN